MKLPDLTRKEYIYIPPGFSLRYFGEGDQGEFYLICNRYSPDEEGICYNCGQMREFHLPTEEE